MSETANNRGVSGEGQELIGGGRLGDPYPGVNTEVERAALAALEGFVSRPTDPTGGSAGEQPSGSHGARF